VDVFAAAITAWENPSNPPAILLHALWASPAEARGHVERRLPDKMGDPRYEGMEVSGTVRAGHTRVEWERTPDGRVFPRVYVTWEESFVERAPV
jgi:hypothetical protein